MMKKYIILPLVFLILLACADEPTFVPSSEPKSEDITTRALSLDSTALVPSITVEGLYVNIVDSLFCTTCTHKLPAKASVIDGNALNIRPGSVLCVKPEQFANVQFLNLYGTADRPITIIFCTE